LRGYLAFDHQSGSGWFDDAHRAQADRRAWASMRSLSMRCSATMSAGPDHSRLK